MEQLEDRVTPAAIVPPPGQRFAVSTDAGGGGIVNVFGPDSSLRQSFVAFDGFTGAVRVATGDVNRDGIEDTVVGAGLGPSGGHVRVFDGASGAVIASFFSFIGYAGGVDVAVGDVDNDGAGDIVVGTNVGSSHVKAFNIGGGQLASFFAFGGFAGGVNVTSANYNGFIGDDIIVGTATGTSQVLVFDVNANQIGGFLGLPGFAGGIDVAAGDIRNSDGLAEVLVAPATGAGTPVQMFAGGVGLPIAPIDPGFGGANGLRIAVGDANGDGFPDILVGPGPGQNGIVRAFSAAFLTPVNFGIPAFNGFTGGVFVG